MALVSEKDEKAENESSEEESEDESSHETYEDANEPEEELVAVEEGGHPHPAAIKRII